MSQLTVNYTLAEFTRVSHRPLTARERENAGVWARNYLQPLRRAMGFAICITSYVRTTGGTHTDWEGGAIDIQPCGDYQGQQLGDPNAREAFDWLAAEFDRRLQRMWEFSAVYQTHAFGQIIHERDHNHVTLPGVRNRYGEVWREPFEGTYELASIVPSVALLGTLAPSSPLDVAILAAIVLLLILVSK